MEDEVEEEVEETQEEKAQQDEQEKEEQEGDNSPAFRNPAAGSRRFLGQLQSCDDEKEQRAESGPRIRVSGQLIDAETGKHL